MKFAEATTSDKVQAFYDREESLQISDLKNLPASCVDENGKGVTQMMKLPVWIDFFKKLTELQRAYRHLVHNGELYELIVVACPALAVVKKEKSSNWEKYVRDTLNDIDAEVWKSLKHAPKKRTHRDPVTFVDCPRWASTRDKAMVISNYAKDKATVNGCDPVDVLRGLFDLLA